MVLGPYFEGLKSTSCRCSVAKRCAKSCKHQKHTVDLRSRFHIMFLIFFNMLMYVICSYTSSRYVDVDSNVDVKATGHGRGTMELTASGQVSDLRMLAIREASGT